jgi:hypothetical protein
VSADLGDSLVQCPDRLVDFVLPIRRDEARTE